MFKIIGADEKEYGPISADQIREWIAEGRANGQTMACAEGTHDWKPLEQFPEFGYTATQPVPPLPAAPTAPMTREELLARDYSLDIFSCFTRAWALLKNNFGVMFVTGLLFVALALAVSGGLQLVFSSAGFEHLHFATRQYLSPLYIIFSSVVYGPAMGGFFFVILSLMRGQPATAGDLFAGFKSFQDLFLAKLATGLALTACMIPYNLVLAEKLGPLFDRLQENPQAASQPDFFTQMMPGLASTLPIMLICLIPVTYLSVNWQFVLPLVIDKKMGFWNALGMSWRMVHKHWLAIFGLVVLIGLLNLAGLCICCVGVLFTFPIGLGALMYAYETIFGDKKD